MMQTELTKQEIEQWLREKDEAALVELWRMADNVRRRTVGEQVHLRGLVEISNYCERQCGYCGLRAANKALERYRMSDQEIFDCARDAVKFGYGTIVMQSGEDYDVTREWLADVVRWIKQETPLAVTLSMGERSHEELAAWRKAGADRYLLRFETSDPNLYRMIHPQSPVHANRDRLEILRDLRELDYEVGSGVMVGIPGQTYASLANDIDLFRGLDLDMIGVGPYISHPVTPLGRNEHLRKAPPEEQTPNTELMTYKVVALARLVCPEANIPSTTALATLNIDEGRELGLQRGANVIMPNLTPTRYRALYEIYPSKACIFESSDDCRHCLSSRIQSVGRKPGVGPGGRVRNR